VRAVGKMKGKAGQLLGKRVGKKRKMAGYYL
jgi:hypothetical protein